MCPDHRRRLPALPRVINTFPSGLNLKTCWPLPLESALSIGYPEVSILVHGNAVWKHEHARAKTLQQFAGRIELEYGREV